MKKEEGFTVIELLVVIAIIATLLGLLFPAFQGLIDRGRKLQAKNDVMQIATAALAFYTEYGKYPVVTDDTPPGDNSDIFYTLRAVASGANAGNAANTRQIVFINLPSTKDTTRPRGGIGSDGQYYDPWGTTYKIAMDSNYDNQIANPYGANNGAGADPIRQGVIVWSYGKDTKLGSDGDGKFTGSDDVISWQ